MKILFTLPILLIFPLKERSHEKKIILKLTTNFEESTHIEDGVEYWMARDIQELLEYKEWNNFHNVIEKAKIACSNSKALVICHFRDVTKMAALLRNQLLTTFYFN